MEMALQFKLALLDISGLSIDIEISLTPK